MQRGAKSHPPGGRSGLSRLRQALGNSWCGLRAAWSHEEAFRQEVLLGLVLAGLALLLDLPLAGKALLQASLLLVLITELLNSAIEAIVDLASPEFHELAGRAKDLASAAVLLALLLVPLVWGMVLWAHYGPD